jgi:hypothetical protein
MMDRTSPEMVRLVEEELGRRMGRCWRTRT